MAHDITHAHPVEAPPDILRRLQEEDENAHLFWLDSGMWVLGRVSPNWARQQSAQKLLLSELAAPPGRQRPEAVQLFRLCAQGFRMTALYTPEQVVSGMVVRDFRERLWRARNRRESTMKDRLAESERMFDTDRQRAKITDMLESEAKSDHGILFRHRKSVSFN